MRSNGTPVIPTDLEGYSQKVSNIKLETGKLVGASYKKNTLSTLATTTNTTSYELTYQFKNDDSINQYMTVGLLILDNGNDVKVTGVGSQPSEKPLSEKKPSGIDILLSLFFTTLIAGSAVNYIKKSPKSRWWILVVILFATLTFSFKAGNLGSLYLSLPIGVIIYWLARKKILATDAKKANMIS